MSFFVGNRSFKFKVFLGSFVCFSLVGIGPSFANPVSISVSPNTPYTDISVFSTGGAYQIDVDANDGAALDNDPVVQFYSDLAPVTYNTLDSANPVNHVGEDDDAGGSYNSQLVGTVGAGNYVIRVSSFDLWAGGPSETATYILTYTGLNRGRLLGNLLSVESAPVLTQNGSSLTCKSSDFGLLNGGVTKQTGNVEAVAYNLLIDGELVSRVVGGNAASIPATLQPVVSAQYIGTATTSSATWQIGSKSNFAAQCQVVGWQNGASGSAVSNSMDDAGKIAAAKAKVEAEESARQAAVMEFYSKENRELRKRLAARGLGR